MNIKTGLLFYVLFIHAPLFSQPLKGKVLSSENNSAIGYVSVGITGKNIGTVSDEAGNFTIGIDKNYDNDSLRFSMIGYESKSLLVRQFKEDSLKTVYLEPKTYNLPELKITYRRPRKIILGTPVISEVLNSGFAYNDLGSELGIKDRVKGFVQITDLNLNVAICTYDSVTYRLNIYESENQTEYKNILTEPIYISFSKDKINSVLTFDLKKYSIFVEGNVLVSLELYKDLGEGRLLFHTEFFTGSTCHRKTLDGQWVESPGVIGMYLDGLLLK